MADDNSWLVWSRHVDQQLKRLQGRVREVEQGLLAAANIMRLERGLPAFVGKSNRVPADKPRHRVPAGRGLSW